MYMQSGAWLVCKEEVFDEVCRECTAIIPGGMPDQQMVPIPAVR